MKKSSVMVAASKALFCWSNKLEQNNTSKQKVGHCDKTTQQTFFHFYNSEHLCFIDIPRQNAAKNIQWFWRRS